MNAKETNMDIIIQILLIVFLLIFGILGYIQYRVRQNRRTVENTPLIAQPQPNPEPHEDEPGIPVVYVDIV